MAEMDMHQEQTVGLYAEVVERGGNISLRMLLLVTAYYIVPTLVYTTLLVSILRTT